MQIATMLNNSFHIDILTSITPALRLQHCYISQSCSILPIVKIAEVPEEGLSVVDSSDNKRTHLVSGNNDYQKM
jgi:hypothetical protein